MSTPGRLDIPGVLKRWADTRGQAGNELVELLQPVVVVGSLPDELPFSVAVPWHMTASVPAGGAGNFGAVCIHARSGAAEPMPAWLELTAIQNLTATLNFAIRVNTGAEAGLVASFGISPRRLRGLTDAGGGLELFHAFRGVTAIAPSSPHYRLTQGEIVPLNLAISQQRGELGVINIVATTANTAFDVTLVGRLHLTSAQ